MEHIQKYKIEDESLDDQMDNYIYSQNSYSSNIQQKNINIISNNSQPKTINVSQPKIQIPELNKNSINSNKNKISNKPIIQQNFNNNNVNVNVGNKNILNSEPKEEALNQIIQNNTEHNLEEINFSNENDLNDNNDNELNDNNENAYHHIQIIDEDVENFKRRLDIMVKNFRTDTLKDFMAIKRNLLIEQKACIENEKQKCDALLSSKGDLIEHLKDDLAKTQKSLNNQIIIKEKLVEILYKKNHDKILKRYKSLAFNGVLMKYHLKKKSKKDKIKKCRQNYWNKYKTIFFKNLKQNWREMQIYKVVSVKEKACDDKLNEMAQKYGKEITDLRNKLNDANILIEQNNQAKAQIQENLKKVLMRGVMAMNMEAMNVLDKDVLKNNDISAIADNIMNNVNEISNTNTNNNTNINNKNPVNIKVGENEENKNMIATVIPANQSFQPLNNNNNNNNGTLLMNNMNSNPINKDSFWLNAPSVPMDIQKNIISTENKFNREAMIMTLNNNNMNILNNLDTNTQNTQGNNMNDFEEDELNSRVYNLSPMNPIDTKYINSNHSLNDPNAIMPHYNNVNNNNDYYDEMKQNMLGIKNEFSMIKQNQSSLMDEESINSYGMGKNMVNNNINNKNSYFNTTNNTSKNNRSNSKKGINSNNINGKKGNIKNNINNNKVPKNNKKGPNNTLKSKK